jgi:hypothetical protein
VTGNTEASVGLTLFNVLLLRPSACKSTISSFMPRLALILGSISLKAENALSTGITKGCASADRSEVELQSASNGIPQR